MSEVTGSSTNDDGQCIVYVRLLGDGVEVARPVTAVRLPDGNWRLGNVLGYDPEDETWEFPPGTVVRCELVSNDSSVRLMAVARLN